MTIVHTPQGKELSVNLPPAEAVVAAYEQSRYRRKPYPSPCSHEGYCITPDGKHWCHGYWALAQRTKGVAL